MRRIMLAVLSAGLLAGFSSATALALVTPTTGQPGAPTNTCGSSNPSTPGSAANAPGSVFNPGGQSGNVYAGNTGSASLANSNSTATVSQYDTACVRLSNPPN